MLHLRFLLLSFVAAFATSSFGVTASPVKIADAWIRIPAPGAQTTAAYMTIENTSKKALRLTDVTVDGAKAAEFHATKMEPGASMSMKRLPELGLATGAKAQLAPGGLHVMIFGFAKELSEGATVDLTLTLDDGRKVTTTLKARAQ